MPVFHVHLCDIKAAGGRHLRTSIEASLELTKMVGYHGEASKTTCCPAETWEYGLESYFKTFKLGNEEIDNFSNLQPSSIYMTPDLQAAERHMVFMRRGVYVPEVQNN